MKIDLHGSVLSPSSRRTYVLEGPPIEGGHGCVYKATTLGSTSGAFALKFHAPGTSLDVVRSKAEAAAIEILTHPHIVRYEEHFVWEDSGPRGAGPLDVLVMEWIEGPTLDKWLEKDDLPLADRIQVALDVLSALVTIHTAGRVHRDLKPTNILITAPERNPHAVVVDFSIVKTISHRLTRHRFPMGTYGYLAPEQESDPGTVTASADLFGFGCVLYELIAKQPLFPRVSGGTASGAFGVMQSFDAAGVPRKAAEQLGALVESLANCRPEGRPPNARAAYGMLKEVRNSNGR